MILSIENHCSVVQQKKMAQYLTDILGDKLDLSSVSSEDATMLPSPQMLKGKILVKVSLLGLSSRWTSDLGPSWSITPSVGRLFFGGGDVQAGHAPSCPQFPHSSLSV